ncbi:hypothetical protein PENTCL1PPCAC_25160, partial [Pristionchus entomophagus]
HMQLVVHALLISLSTRCGLKSTTDPSAHFHRRELESQTKPSMRMLSLVFARSFLAQYEFS